MGAIGPFTVDAAAALPGPDWLRDRRRAAAATFAATGVPSTEEEVWRYSRIAELDLAVFSPVAPNGAAPEVSTPDSAAAATAVVVDGHIGAVEVDPAWAARGLTVSALANLDESATSIGSALSHSDDPFVALNDAFGADPLVVRVPDGLTVDQPVVIEHRTETEGAATFPRLLVDVGADAALAVVDRHDSEAVAALVVPVVELVVGRAGRLDYVNDQNLGSDVWQVANHASRLESQARLVAASVGLGGDYARVRIDCRLVGRGASGDLLSVYFGSGDQMLDYRTFQDHVGPDTTSNLLFKGAVGGRSRSVYSGLIRVRPEARGTNAFQTNRNLKLSEHAWAESVPNLEIENNEVHCSHASAVGPVDEDQRFYLESRGVPPAEAERLVVAGFFDEVLDRLPIGGLADSMRGRLAAKLEQGYAHGP